MFFVFTCLGENHGRDLLGREGVGAIEVLNLDLGVAVVVNDLEGPGLNVLLDGGILEATTDQTLDIEDGVLRVHGSLVLGSLTDQTLVLSEGDERGGSEATLLVGDDLDIAALVDSHARVGGTWMEEKKRLVGGQVDDARGSRSEKAVKRKRRPTKINANGTVVKFVSHYEGICEFPRCGRGWRVDGERRAVRI